MEVRDQGEKSHTALWTINLKNRNQICCSFNLPTPPRCPPSRPRGRAREGGRTRRAPPSRGRGRCLRSSTFADHTPGRRACLILSGANNRSSFSLDPVHHAPCVNNLYSRLFEQNECRVGWTGHWSNPRLQKHLQVKTHLRERRILFQCLEQGKYDHLFRTQNRMGIKKGWVSVDFVRMRRVVWQWQCKNCSKVKYLKGTRTDYVDDRNTWTEELKLCSIEDILFASTEASLAGTYLKVVVLL